MNSRERVIRAIEFDGPDKIPIAYILNRVILENSPSELIWLFARFPPDLFDPVRTSTTYSATFQKGEFTDEWGCVWYNAIDGFIGGCRFHPLSNWESLAEYKFPNPLDSNKFELCERVVKENKCDKYIVGGWDNFFERMHFLRGYENFMVDLIRKPKELYLLADEILKYNLARIKRWCETGIDAVLFMDDWGTQQGLMVRPQLWRDFFKPYYKKMFDSIKKRGKHVFFHSDGYIVDIIPDLIECGVDVLFAQMWIPSVQELGKKFGGKVCFFGDPDRQSILPFGTPDEVKKHVRDIIKAFDSSNGGLIGCSSIDTPEVPLDNIKAVYETYSEYGKHQQK